MKKINVDFYRRENVLQIARELLGKIVVTRWKGVVTSGRIVEVEAYTGIFDKASHAFAGRRTARTGMMYADGGVAYIYLCYGIHHLFNVVTNKKEIPHAILIRALEPVKGKDSMLKRFGINTSDNNRVDKLLTKGPGKLSKALGITTLNSGYSLVSKEFFIAADGFSFTKKEIAVSPRIGVDYAGHDALLPYRFYIKGNLFVSGKPK